MRDAQALLAAQCPTPPGVHCYCRGETCFFYAGRKSGDPQPARSRVKGLGYPACAALQSPAGNQGCFVEQLVPGVTDGDLEVAIPSGKPRLFSQWSRLLFSITSGSRNPWREAKAI
jgi:hypothetical protein